MFCLVVYNLESRIQVLEASLLHLRGLALLPDWTEINRRQCIFLTVFFFFFLNACKHKLFQQSDTGGCSGQLFVYCGEMLVIMLVK